MKKAFIQTFIFFLSIFFEFSLNSQISKKLWGVESFGDVTDFKFTDSSSFLLTSKKGILTLFDLNRKEISIKKNFIHENSLKLESTENYSLLIDENNKYADLLDSKSLKIKHSINLHEEGQSFKIQFGKLQIKENPSKNKLIGVYIDEISLKIFDQKKLKKNFKSNMEDLFIDFNINEKTFEIFVLTYNKNENLFKISNSDFNSKINKIESFFEFSPKNKKNHIKTLFSSENFLIIYSDYSFTFGQLKKGSNKKTYQIKEGNLNISKSVVKIDLTYIDNSKFLVHIENSNESSIYIMDIFSPDIMQEVDFDAKNLIKSIILDNGNEKSPIIFIVKKTQTLNRFLIIPFIFDNLKNKLSSLEDKQIDLHENDQILSIKGRFLNSQKTNFSYLIATKLHQIRYVLIHDNISEIYYLINQPYRNIIKSELITVKNLDVKKKNKPNLNTFASVIHHKDFGKILKNAYDLVVNDIKDIITNIKSSIKNILELGNQKIKENITTKNEKHYLILYTGNFDLFILDAITGEKKFEKNFVNFDLINVKNPNENKIQHGKRDYIEVDNNLNSALLNLELRSNDSNSEEILIIQLNLKDFSFQEIDINLKNYHFFDEIHKKISENLGKNHIVNDETSYEYLKFNFEPYLAQNTIDDKILLNYDYKNNILSGLKFSYETHKKLNQIVRPIWNFRLNNHKLINYQLAKVPENVHTVYNSSGKIIYKHIDHNVALIITNIDKSNNVVLTLINIINGKILYQTNLNNVDLTQKIYSIFDENFVIISYVKKTKNVLRNEIFTVEIMKREIEHSLLSIFDKIFNIKNLFSAFNPTEEDKIEMGKIENIEQNSNEQIDIHSDDLVFLTKTFFSPRKIKNLFLNKSKLNVANKYIILLLESNQLFLVDKRAISPRRPFAKVDPKAPNAPPVIDPVMNSPYADLEISPYSPNILLDPKFIVDVNFSYSNIDNVVVQPTRFESTFILCSTGNSLNCYKVYPDKTFDYFVSIFPNIFIVFALLGLFVLTFTFRRYVKKLEFKNLFLNS